MKKILPFVLFCALSLNALFAQPTLTSSSAPTPGLVVYSQGCDTTAVLPGSSGANVTWDFANLIPDSIPLATTYVDPATTQYGSYFPTSTVAQAIDTMYSMYYTLSSSLFQLDGFGGYIILEQFSDPQTLMTFPFTYNSAFTDAFYATNSSWGYTTYHWGSTNVTGDGYGTLILPDATYSNVLRVKTTGSSRDSSNIMGQVSITDRTQESYGWYTGTDQEYVFQINFNTSTYQGTTSYSKSVAYRPSSTSISALSETTGLSVYPNPAHERSSVSLNLKNESHLDISVYDLSGKKVLDVFKGTMQSGKHTVSFDCGSLPSGIYQITAKSDNSTSKTKLVVE